MYLNNKSYRGLRDALFTKGGCILYSDHGYNCVTGDFVEINYFLACFFSPPLNTCSQINWIFFPQCEIVPLHKNLKLLYCLFTRGTNKGWMGRTCYFSAKLSLHLLKENVCAILKSIPGADRTYFSLAAPISGQHFYRRVSFMCTF